MILIYSLLEGGPVEACKGCSIEDVCNLRDYNSITAECPCCKCLVKITCRPGDGCDDYYDFLERMENEWANS